MGPNTMPRCDAPFGLAQDADKSAAMLDGMRIGTAEESLRRLGEKHEGGEEVDDSRRVSGYAIGRNGATVLAQALLVNTTLCELR
jgi:hypothetical protein